MSGDHAGPALSEKQERALGNAPTSGRRRVTTPVPAGSDPNPLPEPPRSTGTENDAQLKADKPPHWG